MNNYNQLNDKIKGCLFGGAVGDALGYPVEFMSYHEIIKKYGPKGIIEYDIDYSWLNKKFRDAQISDDTQMTLYTAEAIMKNTNSIEAIIENTKNAYLVWMSKQTGIRLDLNIDLEIAKIEALNKRRAPGTTCINALQSINSGKEVKNDSMGCGGVMRVAPVGILGAIKGWDYIENPFDNKTMKLAAEISKITLCHEFSTYSSALYAEIIRQCIIKEEITIDDLKEIIKEAIKILVPSVCGFGHYWAMMQTRITNLFKYLDDPRDDWQIIESELGEGWVAPEALVIALFCVLRHFDDFSGCLIAAVNHSGDSDSTGAIAGNIIGAILGYKRIPQSYIVNIQNRDYIDRISHNLMALKIDIVNIQDLNNQGIKFWIEASGYIEKRLVEYGAFMIPNNLAHLLLKVPSNELILLEKDRYHYIKFVGNNNRFTKMLFGIRDMHEFNSYICKIDESEGFGEYAEKKFEDNNEKDLTKKAIFIIENIYRCNEEDEFYESLPHWVSLLTWSRDILLTYDKKNRYIAEANYLLETMPPLKLMELPLLNVNE